MKCNTGPNFISLTYYFHSLGTHTPIVLFLLAMSSSRNFSHSQANHFMSHPADLCLLLAGIFVRVNIGLVGALNAWTTSRHGPFPLSSTPAPAHPPSVHLCTLFNPMT